MPKQTHPSDPLEVHFARRLDGVDGWLHPAEAATLYRAARSVPQRDRTPLAVEIGSWMGRSTISLADGIRERGGRVVAIDPAIVAEGEVPEDAERRNRAFIDNLKRAGVDRIVEPVRLMSHEARPLVGDGSVDVLFVDGSHQYEDVVQDIDDWTSALAPGAVVGFNDPFLYGVRRALQERVARRRSPYRRPRFVTNTIFFDFAPGEPWTRGDALDTAKLRILIRGGGALKGRRFEELRSKPPRPLWDVVERSGRAVLKRLLPTATQANQRG